MNTLAVVLAWSVGGLLGALLLPRVRRRRLAVVVPLAAAVAALLTTESGPDLVSAAAGGGLHLGRPAGGLVLICALATAVWVLLAPPPDAGEILVLGACGALATVALAAGSPLVWGVALLGGTALFAVRLIAEAPSRVTLAAGRVAGFGVAALAAAAPFLPVDLLSPKPRAHVAAGLLAGGVAAGFALVPVGGWVPGVARTVRAGALAPWALLLVPALLLTAQPLDAVLPSDARSVLGFVLLPAGAVTAGWAAGRGIVAGAADRYPRVLVADLGLVAMGLTTPQPGVRLGSLLLVVTHLCVGPLLLQDQLTTPSRPRRLAWLALSGIPPGPAFWGRFAIGTALVAAFGGGPLVVALPSMAAITVVAVRAIIAAPRPPGARPLGLVTRVSSWLPALAAITVGLVPDAAVRALFGVG